MFDGHSGDEVSGSVVVFEFIVGGSFKPQIVTFNPLVRISIRDLRRALVSSVAEKDLLVRTPPPDIINLPFGHRYALIFLNLAADNGVFQQDDVNEVRLFGVLCDLQSILADKGTLVVALEDLKCDYPYLEREGGHV